MNFTGIKDSTAIRSIFQTFATTNTKPSGKVQAAHKRLTTVSEAYANRPHEAPNALAVAIIAALERGERDPAADPQVQRIVTNRQLPDHDETITEDLTHRVRDTLQADLANVLNAWRIPFNASAKSLKAAHDVLGPVDLSNTSKIIRGGPTHAAAWGNAQTALATIETVASGYNMLRVFLTGRLLPKQHRMAAFAHVTADQWLDMDIDNQVAEPWVALGLGLNLALPSFESFDRLIADIASTRQNRQAAVLAAAPARPSLLPVAPEAA